MAKLFLFAIGGTGSRVVKSLCMLMAAGINIPGTEKVIPIIIDPDSANGDLTRTVEILKLYKELREKSHSDKSNFYKTKISSLDELGDQGFVSDNFRFEIEGVKDHVFKDFIGYSELDRNNKAFISLLFSKTNLNADMEVGFKGNPNIGSVVLNKFKSSDFFKKFASNFEAQDRVFIISSIFGGTGAAGFPLILKNIRDAKPPMPHHVFLQNAKIGAVTLLPYFSVTGNGNTTIDSNAFISKTKAALSYYSRNVTGNRSINALYYIGDKVTNEQQGADGAYDQKNKAHFIELASALSIVDFMEIDDQDLIVNNGQAVSPRYYEFGLLNESTNIYFNDLSKQTYDLIARPLTQYTIFKSFMDNDYESLNGKKGEAWSGHGVNKLSKESIDPRFMTNLKQFNRHFTEWLNEMSLSNISFNPVDSNTSGKNMYNLINGVPVKKGFMKKIFEGSGLDHFRGILSKLEPAFDHLKSNQKLTALFYKSTQDVVENEIKL